MSQLEQLVKRLSTRCLAFFVKDLPVELKPWGDAMLAELPQVRGIFAPVSWAMGGSMVLSKAIILSHIKGKSQRGSSGGAGPKAPRPGHYAALAAFALSFAMVLSPGFRQALATSLESWSPSWSRHQAEQMDRLLKRAEKLHDPAALAFVALNTDDSVKGERLAEQAVREAPKLEWVWCKLIRKQLYSFNPTMDLRGPGVAARIERLKAWDPDNAVPYLLEADRLRWAVRGGFKLVPLAEAQRDAAVIQHDQAWQSAMERAFSAPRYDSYLNRQRQLETIVLKKLKVTAPLAYAPGFHWYAFPIAFSTRQFSDLLLQEGDDALRQGDAGRAGRSYWQAAHFAERVHAQASTSYERFHAAGLEYHSYEKLSALMAVTHQRAEKAVIDQTLASLRKERRRVEDPRGMWEIFYGPVSDAGIAVSIFSAIVVLALALSLAGMGYFLTRQWLRFPAPRLLDFLLTKAAVLAPCTLAASCFCLYLTYLPYAHLYAGTINGTLPPGNPARLGSFMQIRYFPDRVISFFGGMPGLKIWFWGAMVAVMALTVVLFVWRWIPPRNARPVTTN